MDRKYHGNGQFEHSVIFCNWSGQNTDLLDDKISAIATLDNG